MVTEASDISIVLSGGSTNTSVDNSIGGEPSAAAVVNNMLDNLFSDLTSDETQAGGQDYRCFYVFNDGDSTIYTINTWILEKAQGDTSIALGIRNLDEIQRIIISGSPTGGTLTLSYENVRFTWGYQSNLNTWAGSLQNTLNSLLDSNGNPLLRQTIVTGRFIQNVYIFDINFQGQDGSRSHDLIALVTNNLSPTSSVTTTRMQTGSPINAVAELTITTNTPPLYVDFTIPTQLTPILIPKLKPAEGFSMWVQRTYPANSTALASDGFNMGFQAQILDPLAIES